MKRYILIVGLALAMLTACKKNNTATDLTIKNNPDTGDGTNTGTIPNTVGNTTNYNGYVVKSIGISRIVVSLDANNNLATGLLYGGGNEIILKPGTGNTVELAGNGGYSVIPDVFAPDGTTSYINDIIDNGKMPVDTTGAAATIIKIKGFDKQKIGYNQLNLVMYKLVWAMSPGSAGYYTNITYLNLNKPFGKKNVDYSGTFFKNLFTGSIAVSSVQMAVPLSQNPYITEDQLVSAIQIAYNPATNTVFSIRLNSPFYQTLFNYQSSGFSFGTNLKMQLVNADNTTLTKFDDYTSLLKFNNMKVGNLGMIAEPADSINRPFLRITGIDPKVAGFNQLRLFFADDSYNDGIVQLIQNAKPATTPTAATIKNAFNTQGLYCTQMMPNWAHY